MVDVVDGPLKGRGGTVRYIMRGFVFVQTREVSEHAGFICLQARHTKVGYKYKYSLLSLGGINRLLSCG